MDGFLTERAEHKKGVFEKADACLSAMLVPVRLRGYRSYPVPVRSPDISSCPFESRAINSFVRTTAGIIANGKIFAPLDMATGIFPRLCTRILSYVEWKKASVPFGGISFSSRQKNDVFQF